MECESKLQSKFHAKHEDQIPYKFAHFQNNVHLLVENTKSIFMTIFIEHKCAKLDNEQFFFCSKVACEYWD